MQAIFYRVIKATQRTEAIVAEIGKTCIERHGVPLFEQLIKQRLQVVSILQDAAVDGMIDRFPILAVGLLQ